MELPEEELSEELDRAIALSLQEAFDKELPESEGTPSKTSRTEDDAVVIVEGESEAEDVVCSNDRALAVLLQEDFARVDEEDGSSRALALVLQKENEKQRKEETTLWEDEELRRKRYDPMLIVDSLWEKADPTPNVHALFVDFDTMFFQQKLTNAGVVVSWGPRMTLCAGLCCYEGRGGLCSIKLSEPLLKLRPRRDLVETLLHEMIHAYLFVTANNKDHDGHGPEFCKHMTRINGLTGARITVYHNFNEEVNQYRQHVWKCNGKCQHRPPFYGILRRASNRAPSPRDNWWAEHQATCGGEFIKFSEPEGYKPRTASKKGAATKGRESVKSGDIKEMLQDKTAKNKTLDSSRNTKQATSFPGKGHVLSGNAICKTDSQLDSKSLILHAAEERLKQCRGKVIEKPTSTTSTTLGSMAAPSGLLVKRSSEPSSGCSSAKKIRLCSDKAACSSHSSASSESINFSACPPPSMGSARSSPILLDVATKPEDNPMEVDVIDITNTSPPSSQTTPTTMCPVCGRTDIPTPVINSHIAYCLEEMELASEEEIF